MANGIDGEQFLLRNQVSEALGCYSPFYNSVLIPMPIFEGQDEQLLSTLFHEKTHWAQFNLSPWGQFLLYLYEFYVGLSEEILVHTKATRGRIDKPLWIFMASGSRREHDERLNALCNDHITALDALPLLFRGGNTISTQALDDAIKTLRFFAIVPERRQELMESEAFPLTASSLPAVRSGVPSWRSLVETWARTVELLAGVRHGFSTHDRSGVLLEQIMQGDYGALFPIFLELSGLNAPRINEIQTYSMLAVCAVAMQSPVHPGFAGHWGGLSDWSDVYPETRFIKAARAVQATGPVGDLRPDDPRQHEIAVADLMDRICAHLGWPSAGELAEGFAQRCSNAVVTPGLYAPGYLTAAPLISRDPSLLAFGPCHSAWDDFETRIGSVPVFVDPLLSKRVPGPAALDNLEPRTHTQILTGVKFNLFNEILYEDSFSKFEIDAFTDGAWVEDQAARSVADSLFITPVLDALECRGVHVKDIFQWDVYTRGSEGNKKLILVKSAMHRDFNAVFDRDPVPWLLAVNGQQRE
jgi:hypothetical protein